jgi:hypothetical protein
MLSEFPLSPDNGLIPQGQEHSSRINLLRADLGTEPAKTALESLPEIKPVFMYRPGLLTR